MACTCGSHALPQSSVPSVVRQAARPVPANENGRARIRRERKRPRPMVDLHKLVAYGHHNCKTRLKEYRSLGKAAPPLKRAQRSYKLRQWKPTSNRRPDEPEEAASETRRVIRCALSAVESALEPDNPY